MISQICRDYGKDAIDYNPSASGKNNPFPYLLNPSKFMIFLELFFDYQKTRKEHKQAFIISLLR